MREQIKTAHTQEPAVKTSVVLIGRVPVPYAGVIFPDSHDDHRGAWPADVYYGDMDGTWTDEWQNVATSSRAENNNTIGDGKFDQSVPPAVNGIVGVELEVGRIDLRNMPAFGVSESELLARYFRKNHSYRHALRSVPRRALVTDNFGYLGSEVPAMNGWWNFPTLVGAENVEEGPWIPSLAAGSYLWAYGCGPAGYQGAGGVGSTGDYATHDLKAEFVMTFGSYFGDWDTENNFLRAPLGGINSGLASMWVGRPNWFVHHMALGETIGFSTKLTQNNVSSYEPGIAAREIHIALMGDPTLRLYPVKPVSGLTASTQNGNDANLQWQPSPDATVGYYVYVANAPQGPFTRVNAAALADTHFTYTGPSAGKTFMVRALKLEVTPSGSFYNPSQGVFYTAATTPHETPPTVSLSVIQANAAELNAVPGTFLISRSGPIDASLTVNLACVGVAQNGVDHQTLPPQVVIPAGATSITASVIPNIDALAEGTETVMATVSPSVAYTIGSNNQASVRIADSPFDAWRFENFSEAERSDPVRSGPTGDANGNGLSNLLDYALLTEAQATASLAAPVVSTGGFGSQRFLQLAYRRNHAASDLEFVVELADPLDQNAWASGDDLTTVVSTTDNGDGSDTVVVRENRTIGSNDSRFLRLKVKFR
ncbi:MAG: fibronectin type III domain-containing protein [Bryobacteraceae bacterium]|nr:fibronectin type III domain-containing protein [Bryobacteraceae bacterium]